MTFNTIKKALLFAALTVCPLFGHSQVTTGWHRVAQVVARGSSGTQAVVVPNANIYVTGTGSGTVATIYSDPLLSIPIPTGMVTSDSSGNYSYYMPLGYCVNERASYPGSGNFTTYNICTLSGGGVTQIIAGTGISISPSGGTGAVTINSTGGCVMQGASGTFNVSDGTGGCLSIPADFGATWPDSYTLNTVGTSTGNGAADFNLNLSQTATSRNSAGVYIDLEDHGANIYGAQYNFLSNSDGVNGAFYLIDLTAGVGAGAGTWELDTSTGNALPSHNAASNSANMDANLVAGGGTNAATFSNSGNFQLSTTCDNLGTHCGDAEFDLGGEGTTAENFIVTTQASSHADSGNFKVDTLSTTGGGGQAEFDLSSTGAGFNITAPSFSMTLPSDTIAKINSEIICTASNGACSSGGAATYITVDGTGTPPTNYQALTAGANITLTPNAGAHTMTIASTGGSGVQYNPSNTQIVFTGSSINGDDTGNTLGETFPVSSWTCNGATCSVVNTGTNGLVVGDWVYMRNVTGWPFNTDLNSGVTLFQVLSSGLSSTGFTFNAPLVASGSGSGGTFETANNFLPFFVSNLPFFKGHGQVSLQAATMAALASGFSSIIGSATTSPAYLVVTSGWVNDIGACTSAGTIETDISTMLASAHTNGWTVLMTSAGPLQWNTSNTGCTTAYKTWVAVDKWIRGQGPTTFNTTPYCTTACGKYWDRFADLSAVAMDLGNTNYYVSGASGAFAPGGIAFVGQKINEAMSTQGSSTAAYPYFAVPIPFASGSLYANTYGQGFAPTQDSHQAFGFFNASLATTYLSIDTVSNHLFFPFLAPASTGFLCIDNVGTISSNTSPCASVSTGLSGMTAGQVPLAATATTVTSSKALGGTGAAIATGPSSSTANDIVTYADTSATQQDSGILITAVPAANIASGSLTNGMAATTQTGGDNTTKLATTAFVQAAIAAAGTGAGIVTYSGPSLTLTGTQYFPIGGGATSSTTETNVDIDSPAAVTIQNMTVQMSAAPGVGNSVVFTWRKNAAGTALTCTISGASATSCSDTTHNFSTAALDLLDIQAVTTGSIVGTPTVVMAAQVGIAATATTAFSAISGGTNTAAAMTVGSGASLGVGGTGTINATSVGGITITGTPSAGQVPTATSSSAATWQSPTNNSTPLFLHYVKVNQSGSVASITSPSITVTSGNLAVVGCRYAGSGAATGSVASGSSVTSWNLITTSATSTVGVQLSWGVITSSGSTTFTCTPSATSTGQSMVVMEFSGAGTTANNSSQGSSASLSSFGPFFTAGMTASTTSQRTLAVTCTSVALTTSFFVQPTWVNAINSSLVGFADDMGCYMTIIPFAIASGQGGQFTISSGSSVSNANSTVYMNY